MLVLTRETGQPVLAGDGSVVGTLRDLTVRVGTEHPRVAGLLVRGRHGTTSLVPWAHVQSFEHSAVQLRADARPEAHQVGREGPDLGTDALLLRRDVLDTQVVDVAGHRVARVSDVLLVRLADGELEAAAVDVGLGAALRRLGVQRLGLGRLADRAPERVLDWRDLHLTSDRGHEVQLASTTSAVHRLDARALAELLTRLSLEPAADVLRAVGPERAAGAVDRTHPVVASRLVGALPAADAERVLAHLPAESSTRLRRHLATRSTLSRRRFTRLAGWRLHRPGGTP